MEKSIKLVLAIALINISTCGITHLSQDNPLSVGITASSIFNTLRSPLTNNFNLSFQYACKDNTVFSSCTGQVLWNGGVIHQIRPNDYEINTVNLIVKIKNGKNSLSFVGTGVSDRVGLTIDNVRLVRNSSNSQNIVINGDFARPFFTTDYMIYNKFIPGWRGERIQLGRGNYYNKRWSSQVCQLDGDYNYEITQDFQFNKMNSLMKLDWISCDETDDCEGFYEDDRFC